MLRDIHHFLTAAAMVVALVAFAPGCDDGRPRAEKVHRDDGTIVVITPADMPPYSYYDEEAKEFKGIEIDFVRTAAKKLGRKVEVRQCPFDELLGRVKSGEADVAVSVITITDARKEDVDFSIPYETGGASFLYRVGDPMPTMIRAETLRVAAVESMTHDFYLSIHGIDPIRFEVYQDAVEALNEGRVDTVFFDDGVVRHTAETSGGKLAASRRETREHFALVIRKGEPELMAAVNAAIAERAHAK